MTDDEPSPVAAIAEETDEADKSATQETQLIPRQRAPEHDTLPTRWHRRALITAAVVVVLGAATAVTLLGSKPHTGLLGAGAAAAATPATPPAPYDLAVTALSDQAAALLRHDHAGWMAAVDPRQPSLRQHFEQLYAALLALHVTQLGYHNSLGGQISGGVQLNSNLAFCLSQVTCPDFLAADDYDGPPHIAEKLVLRPIGGHYLITKVTRAQYPSEIQPFPWENTPLVYRQGRRVTVAAPKALAGKLPAVLAVADKAALTDDRFAALMQNPQQRYRVFLADDKAWKTWYGGDIATYAVAYTIPTGAAGSDVVLHMSQLRMADLKVVVQHEMGHVATLSNLTGGDDADDMWLKEGVADYIGWLPQNSQADWDFPAARDALHSGHPPATINETPLTDSASDRTANRFYGLAHFAVECLVTSYGQGRAMNFVRLKLREDDDLDTAARQALGASFSSVDKGCLSWMKQHS